MTTGQRDYRRRDSRRTETVGSKSDGAEAVDTDTDANGNGNGSSQPTDIRCLMDREMDGQSGGGQTGPTEMTKMLDDGRPTRPTTNTQSRKDEQTVE